MRFFNLFLIFAIIVAAVNATPVEVENELIEGEIEEEIEPRVTCDILGSDALCAVHCIAKGHRGGWCDRRKVCNCR